MGGRVWWELSGCLQSTNRQVMLPFCRRPPSWHQPPHDLGDSLRPPGLSVR